MAWGWLWSHEVTDKKTAKRKKQDAIQVSGNVQCFNQNIRIRSQHIGQKFMEIKNIKNFKILG